jgi:hypothetical protein
VSNSLSLVSFILANIPFQDWRGVTASAAVEKTLNLTLKAVWLNGVSHLQECFGYGICSFLSSLSFFHSVFFMLEESQH